MSSVFYRLGLALHGERDTETERDKWLYLILGYLLLSYKIRTEVMSRPIETKLVWHSRNKLIKSTLVVLLFI